MVGCVISPQDLSSKLAHEECKGGKRSLPCSYARSRSSDHHVHISVPHAAQGATSLLSPTRDRASLLRVKCACAIAQRCSLTTCWFLRVLFSEGSDSLQHTRPWEGAELFLRGYILRLSPSLFIGEVYLISQQACRQESNLS